MADARIVFLLGMSLGWLVACREEPSLPAGTTAATMESRDTGMFRWVEQTASDTALDALLADHARRAAEQGLKPVLYVGASWCQPCKLLRELRDDPQVASALRGTYTIEVDFDDWSVAELSRAGYGVQAVPVFFAIRADGRAAGPRLDGDAWGGADAAHVAAAFQRFFHQL